MEPLTDRLGMACCSGPSVWSSVRPLSPLGQIVDGPDHASQTIRPVRNAHHRGGCFGRPYGRDMDKGAHFYRCDFQVHTPRDTNWKGERPLTEEDREAYADSLVAACRSRGLHAIAITDHHDFELVPYVRAAAAREVDEEGRPLPPQECLVVFPGLELTLGVPCQALLLLDADFPTDKLAVVLQALAIDPVPSQAPSLGTVTRLDHIDSLKSLYETLDAHAWLRGLYIVLPNVTDGGHQTLMRSGMQGKYKEMPCCGGYLDGLVTAIGEGNSRIFGGLDQNWGNKRLAVFQTSDSRRDDFSDLGKHSTWVKWARPTAEAIRQACLAEESRISHARPQLPSMHITRVSVSNSSFMGPVELELNQQYNAIIGGRGTGKSTCLEYLRWALCDQAVSAGDDDEIPDHATRRERLMAKTLAPFDAHVDVHFLLNELPHLVRRYAKTGEVMVKVGDAELTSATPADIQSLLPVVAYSQKQLSSVAVRLDELYRFVTTPIMRQLEDIDKDIATLTDRIRENYAALLRHRSLTSAIVREELNAASLASQADNIRESIETISEEDQKLIAKKPLYDRTAQQVSGMKRDLEEVRSAAQVFETELAGLTEREYEPVDQAGPLQDELADMQAELKALFQSLHSRAGEMIAQIEALNATHSSFSGTERRIALAISEFRTDYATVTERSSAHETQLQELRDVEQRHQAAEDSVSQYREELRRTGDPVGKHTELRAEWRRLEKSRFDAISEQCIALSELSGGLIRAAIRAGAGLHGMIGRLKRAVQGSGIRAAKIEQACVTLAAAEDPSAAWETMLWELEAVVASPEESERVPTPTLLGAGFAQTDIAKMASILTPESWLDLALTPIQDQPHFEYMSKDGEYFNFDEASAGQQATALLRVLLAQGGPPLIIDQPEDDLDSQVIVEIVEQVWTAKKSRQLIFASHNANLVVNGDAELVISCDYRAAGDHSGGRLKLQGAIDLENMREEITQIMEGGEKAFKLRKEKYGF